MWQLTYCSRKNGTRVNKNWMWSSNRGITGLGAVSSSTTGLCLLTRRLAHPALRTRTRASATRDGSLASNLVRLSLTVTNPEFFQIRFQYILALRAKMYWNLIWKIPGFVLFLFGANLTHYGGKPDSHVRASSSGRCSRTTSQPCTGGDNHCVIFTAGSY